MTFGRIALTPLLRLLLVAPLRTSSPSSPSPSPRRATSSTGWPRACSISAASSGQFLDPAADKFMVLVTFIVAAATGAVPVVAGGARHRARRHPRLGRRALRLRLPRRPRPRALAPLAHRQVRHLLYRRHHRAGAAPRDDRRRDGCARSSARSASCAPPAPSSAASNTSPRASKPLSAVLSWPPGGTNR